MAAKHASRDITVRKTTGKPINLSLILFLEMRTTIFNLLLGYQWEKRLTRGVRKNHTEKMVADKDTKVKVSGVNS
jgi:hypothetical protein